MGKGASEGKGASVGNGASVGFSGVAPAVRNVHCTESYKVFVLCVLEANKYFINPACGLTKYVLKKKKNYLKY